MKITINPAYTAYEEFIRQIPAGNYRREHVFRKHRNVVEKVLWNGKPFVIKKFKRPTIANCVIYTWFRKSKPRRAYENALHLLNNGIGTALPVAYIERKKWGFFHTGYFISEFVPHPTLEELDEKSLTEAELNRLKMEAIKFTLEMHRKKILPIDYNRSNIFYHMEDGAYKFSVIDINRMKTGKVPELKDAMKSIGRLNIPIEDYKTLIGEYYAPERGFDADKCYFMMLYTKFRYDWVRSLKSVLFPWTKR